MWCKLHLQYGVTALPGYRKGGKFSPLQKKEKRKRKSRCRKEDKLDDRMMEPIQHLPSIGGLDKSHFIYQVKSVPPSPAYSAKA